MNPIYEMFNEQYIQQQAQQRHITQISNIQKSAFKLKDFLNSLAYIAPEYQNDASMEFCAILFEHMNKNSN